jgi:hypothetical protein
MQSHTNLLSAVTLSATDVAIAPAPKNMVRPRPIWMCRNAQ